MDPCQRREKESPFSRGRYSPASSCWSVAKNSTGKSVACMSFHEPLASAMSCLQSWRCSFEWVCMRAGVAHCCCCSRRSLVSVDLSVVEQPFGCFSAPPSLQPPSSGVIEAAYVVCAASCEDVCRSA